MVVEHTNRLAREKSPYLLQHAHNPVDWFAWGSEAFDRARAENKPIFLSIGYSTCHWCHVMERESFENEKVAKFLQRAFYQHQGGSRGTAGRGQNLHDVRPVHDRRRRLAAQRFSDAGSEAVFWGHLFPAGQPPRPPGLFDTCSGKSPRSGRNAGTDITNSAGEMHARLATATAASHGCRICCRLRTCCAMPPRFSRPPTIRYTAVLAARRNFRSRAIPSLLFRCAKRFHEPAGRMVLHTCERMAAGGIHDQLGGGFARYAVDAEWLVPHFEKMLYDNAQLAQLYLDAFLVSGDARHADMVRDILDYVLRDMTHPAGGFYSAEDADSEGHEGKFYCWTNNELSELLTAGGIQRGRRVFRRHRRWKFC